MSATTKFFIGLAVAMTVLAVGLGSKMVIGQWAGVLATVAFLLYIIAIIKGETTPNRMTWFVWSVNGVLTLGSYWAVGADATIWLPVAYAVLPVVVFLLSLKMGEGGWSRLDITCLVIAAFGLLAWWQISGLAGLICFLIADLAAAIPTIQKSWARPESEDRVAWTITSVGAIANLFALDSASFGVVVYPVYILVVDCVITVMVWRKR